jgi:hypothetical protein
LNRAKDGYGETEFEEAAEKNQWKPNDQYFGQSVERNKKLADPNDPSGFKRFQGVFNDPKQTDQPKKEAAAPPSAPQSTRPRVKDKSQMKGVGPRPNLANAFDENAWDKFKELGKMGPKPPDEEAMKVKVAKAMFAVNPNSPKGQAIKARKDREATAAASPKGQRKAAYQQAADDKQKQKNFDKHFAPIGRGPAEAAAPPSAPQTTRPRIKDKSQMQGVGGQQSLTQVFGNDQPQQPQKKEAFKSVYHKRPKDQDNSQQILQLPAVATRSRFAHSDRSKMKTQAKSVPGDGQSDADRSRSYNIGKELDAQGKPHPMAKEASIAATPPIPQSNRPPKRDKSQMQGVGGQQSLTQVFGNDQPQQPQKKEAARRTVRMDMDTFPHPNNREPFDDHPDQSSPDLEKSYAMSGKKPGDYRTDGGIGKPSLPNKQEGSEDQTGNNFNPNKTSELPPEENPDSSDADRTFQKTMNGQLKAAKQQAIKQISHQQQAEMQAQGWKFDRQPDGNWSASPPKSGGSSSSMQKQESKKSKKR